MQEAPRPTFLYPGVFSLVSDVRWCGNFAIQEAQKSHIAVGEN